MSEDEGAPALRPYIFHAMATPITRTGIEKEDASSTKLRDHEIIEQGKEASQSSDQSYSTAFTDEELVIEKKLRMKLDLTIMPLMVWT